jgi:hypothetical protein
MARTHGSEIYPKAQIHDPCLLFHATWRTGASAREVPESSSQGVTTRCSTKDWRILWREKEVIEDEVGGWVQRFR